MIENYIVKAEYINHSDGTLDHVRVIYSNGFTETVKSNNTARLTQIQEQLFKQNNRQVLMEKK
jgi:hypothetical protein